MKGCTPWRVRRRNMWFRQSGAWCACRGAGRVPWGDVTGFDVFTVQKQRLLVVRVADPDKYIERGSRLRRMFYRANTGMTGSPININAGTLVIDFDEMFTLCHAYFQRYGQPQSDSA